MRPPNHTPEGSVPPLPYVSPDETDLQGFNVFRRIMGTIESPDQLNFIFRGFARLLNNVPQAESSYLPYSITRVSIEQELLVLLWKCLEEIPKFMPYILRHCDITELLVPICYFMLEGRKDPAKVGLMYLCTFTLLKLSGERNFGVTLNKPYQLRLPVDVPLFSGNHTDLLIIVLHKLIVSGLEKLSALYNCFLTIICNVSPYCKCLSTVASVKLVNLFQLFTSPRFLYANEGNHIYVSMLLETFNNIVQYQYEGNVNVVYAIVKRKEIFESLSGLTLPAAIRGAAEVAAKRQQKAEEKQRKSGAKAGAASGAKKAGTGAQTPASAAAASGQAGATANAPRSTQSGRPKSDDVEGTAVADSSPTDVVGTRSYVDRQTGEGAVEALQDAPSSSGAGADSANGNGAASAAAPAPPGQRFVPTQQWLDNVKAELPMNTIMRLLRHLVPQIDELTSSGGVDEMQVLEFIRQTTMVGLLPIPHPIVIRKYQPNKYTCLWLTAFMWGVIFMHNQVSSPHSFTFFLVAARLHIYVSLCARPTSLDTPLTHIQPLASFVVSNTSRRCPSLTARTSGYSSCRRRDALNQIGARCSVGGLEIVPCPRLERMIRMCSGCAFEVFEKFSLSIIFKGENVFGETVGSTQNFAPSKRVNSTTLSHYHIIIITLSHESKISGAKASLIHDKSTISTCEAFSCLDCLALGSASDRNICAAETKPGRFPSADLGTSAAADELDEEVLFIELPLAEDAGGRVRTVSGPLLPRAESKDDAFTNSGSFLFSKTLIPDCPPVSASSQSSSSSSIQSDPDAAPLALAAPFLCPCFDARFPPLPRDQADESCCFPRRASPLAARQLSHRVLHA